MKEMKYIFNMLLVLCATSIYAQQVPDSINIVQNGSFEEVEGKLKKSGQIELASPWRSATGEDADLYSTAANKYPGASAPDNTHGKTHARSGENYAGANFYSYQGKEPRTYLISKLRSPLKKGQQYCVQYYVGLSDLSKYVVDKVQAYVTNIAVNKDTESNLIYKAQVPKVTSSIIEDQYAWQGVCGTFMSKGFENYIIIGNFTSNDDTQYKKVKRPKGFVKPQQYNAYYYIDDVSIVPIQSKSECSCTDEKQPGEDYIYDKKLGTDKSLPPADQIDRVAVYYKLYRSGVDRVMQPLLDEIVQLMVDNPEIKIRLVGHIDQNEADESKVKPDLATLGDRRANFVKGYLTKRGIDASRITATDAGSTEHADAGEGLIPDAKNRRVGFEVVR